MNTPLQTVFGGANVMVWWCIEVFTVTWFAFSPNVGPVKNGLKVPMVWWYIEVFTVTWFAISPSAESYGSTPQPFPSFEHPSHGLLKENHFVWHVYHKYHSKCINGEWLCPLLTLAAMTVTAKAPCVRVQGM